MDFGRYTEKRYKSIVKYKTVLFSFYLSVAAAMYTAGINGKELANVKKILLEMGEHSQFQYDCLDLFGDSSVWTRLALTSRTTNAATWLVVPCFQWVFMEQHQILQDNYEQKEAEKVALVKAF